MKLLLNRPEINSVLRDNKIVVIDGGARGELFEPFNLVPRDLLKVIRFEADPDAEYITNTENEIIVNKAMWKNSGKININIAHAPTTSSVFPFNRKLQEHIDPFYEKRNTKTVVEVDAISLDEFLATGQVPKIDFIKLDIHGAEYEVLEGAKKALQSTLGLLIESWVIPIHLGQKTRAAVELLALDNGFYVFEEFHRSMWKRKGPFQDRAQPVALDTFFLKDPILDQNIKDYSDAIKIIALADLFGHHNYSIQLANFFYNQKVIDQKMKNIIVKEVGPSFFGGTRLKILRKLYDYSRARLPGSRFGW